MVKTIKIDDVEYVRKDSLGSEKAECVDGLELVMVRSYASGVFYGYLKEKKAELNGVNITLLQARRIHYWDGACSLTQLAIDGSIATENCRITDPIDSQWIANVIELLPMTNKAQKNLDGVLPWKK
jgi:hypothetical protein